MAKLRSWLFRNLFRNSPLFCTFPHWNYFFLVVENHCVFLAHIFWNCALFPRNVREKRKTQTKNYHCVCLIIGGTHCDVRDVMKVRATSPRLLKNKRDTLRYTYAKFYEKQTTWFFSAISRVRYRPTLN